MGKQIEYTVIVGKAPDGFYIASCPLIPEARAQGETYEECMANIKEALELCLEYRKERDEEIHTYPSHQNHQPLLTFGYS